jgi:hypothetical protein
MCIYEDNKMCEAKKVISCVAFYLFLRASYYKYMIAHNSG